MAALAAVAPPVAAHAPPTGAAACAGPLTLGSAATLAPPEVAGGQLQERLAAIDACSTALRGVPAMDVLVRYERSWSIQEALDQHAALAEQREVLAEIGRNRLRVRQAQLSFAEMEVEESLELARSLSAADASVASRVLDVAGRLRANLRNLQMSSRLQAMERGVVSQQIALSEAEINKCRLEMSTLKEVIDDKSLVVARDETQPPAETPLDARGQPLQQRFKYATNCKVGGHGKRFCNYLLERPDWRIYPYQKWFHDDKGQEYHCPLGKKLVDFADESHFSRLCMYLRGRAWLEDKTKVLELAGKLMPDTYIIQGGAWKTAPPPPDDQVSNLPWFVKEADRNWGTSVHLCAKPSECLRIAQSDAVYVVQQHVKDPLLMDDGRKCHIKFYVLLVGYEDGVTWKLYTFRDGYLSISPNKWSPSDLSKETQVTIIRSERIAGWEAWESAYPKCKAATSQIVDRAVREGKLQGRPGKRQFEIFSADYMVDAHGAVWFFEFNMSPVLKDPDDAPEVNDAGMIRGALSIVVPWSGGSPGLWDAAGQFQGRPEQATPEAGAAAAGRAAEAPEEAGA